MPASSLSIRLHASCSRPHRPPLIAARFAVASRTHPEDRGLFPDGLPGLILFHSAKYLRSIAMTIKVAESAFVEPGHDNAPAYLNVMADFGFPGEAPMARRTLSSRHEKCGRCSVRPRYRLTLPDAEEKKPAQGRQKEGAFRPYRWIRGACAGMQRGVG